MRENVKFYKQGIKKNGSFGFVDGLSLIFRQNSYVDVSASSRQPHSEV